jgi:hypothetical protein
VLVSLFVAGIRGTDVDESIDPLVAGISRILDECFGDSAEAVLHIGDHYVLHLELRTRMRRAMFQVMLEIEDVDM